jgi:flap endonuclease-1
MGIQGLSRLIADYAPDAVKENEIKNYFGNF